MQPADVDSQTTFRGTVVPDLGLTGDARCEFRAYVLVCAPVHGETGATYYVGIAHRNSLKRRLASHFDGTGATFTRARKPVGIAYVMPVLHRAAEAYVYFAMLAKLPSKAVRRLGGWVQNETNPSPLTRMLAEESRRNVLGQCFICGGDHFARDCRRPRDAAPYPCKKCGEVVHVSAAGQTLDVVSPCLPLKAASHSRRSSNNEEPMPKRHRAKADEACRRVSVCGQAYTTLSWFLRISDPAKKARETVLRECLDTAVAVQGGDSKTLIAKGFATTSATSAKELLPNRRRLPHSWVDSACSSVLSTRTRTCQKKFLRLRRAQGGRERFMLWRLEDLRGALPGRVA